MKTQEQWTGKAPMKAYHWKSIVDLLRVEPARRLSHPLCLFLGLVLLQRLLALRLCPFAQSVLEGLHFVVVHLHVGDVGRFDPKTVILGELAKSSKLTLASLNDHKSARNVQLLLQPYNPDNARMDNFC